MTTTKNRFHHWEYNKGGQPTERMERTKESKSKAVSSDANMKEVQPQQTVRQLITTKIHL